MIKEFFNIIENHYLYNDINEKMQTLKTNSQFNDLFQQYLTYYDLDLIQNYNLLNLISKMNLRDTYSIPESKKFSLEKTIKNHDDSGIYFCFFYKSGIHTIKSIPTIKNDFSISVRTTNSEIESEISLTFMLSGFQSLEKHRQLLEISTVDYNSYQKTKRYSMSLNQNEQNSKTNRIVLNNVAIEINSDNEIKMETIDKLAVFKLYKELEILTSEQINTLFLTGGLPAVDVELLKITHDFGNSMDNYLNNRNKNIFDIINEKEYLVNNLKTSKKH